ncbi:MAG: flippase [Desulfobaccales bacterium]
MLDFRSQGFKRYFFNTAWIAAENVIRMAVILIVAVAVARYLEPERYGLLSYAVSFAAIFSVFASLGLDTIVIRNLVQDPAGRDRLIGTAFCLKIIGAGLVLIMVFGALQLTSNDRFTKILVLIIAAGSVFQSFGVIDCYFKSQVLARFITLSRLCSLLITSAVKFLLIILKAPLIWFACVTLLETILIALFYVIVYHLQGLKISPWRFDRQTAFKLLKDSWPLILSSLAIMVYMRIDQIMIKSMLNNEAVGNYAVAVRLSEAWYFIPTAISSSLLPALQKAKQISQEVYLHRFQVFFNLMTWMAIAIALPTTLFSGYIINILLGPQYSTAGGVLAINIWAGIFVFLGVASSNFLLVENLTKTDFMRTFIGCIVNVGLNFWWIPKFGINGAAWATLLSYAVAIFSLIFDSRTKHCFIMMVKSFIPTKGVWLQNDIN